MNCAQNQIILCGYAFHNNAKIIRSFIRSTAIAAIVVKANAYGHGLKEVGFLAENNNLVNWLCVFHLSEAALLRFYGYKKPILVMGDWDCDRDIFADPTVVSMVDSIEQIETVNNLGKKFGLQLPVHLKIDTGLCRFGLLVNGIEQFCYQLDQYPFVKIQGIYTHFAQSHLQDQTYTQKQEQLFDQVVEFVQNILGPIEFVHAYNSAATMVRCTKKYNFFRIGLALYGYYSSDFIQSIVSEKDNNAKLMPILTLQSYIMSIKSIPKGSLIGYNCTFQAQRDMKVGLVPFGYCDGYEPAFFENAYGVIDGQAVVVIGRIAMNLIAIDITDCKSVFIGSKISLIDPYLCRADQLCSKAGIANVRTFFSRLSPTIVRNICPQSFPHNACLL